MMYPGSEKFEFAYTVGDKIFVYGEAYRIHSVTIDANGRARMVLEPAAEHLRFHKES